MNMLGLLGEGTGFIESLPESISFYITKYHIKVYNKNGEKHGLQTF